MIYYEIEIDECAEESFMRDLIGKFYKILPLREKNEPTLDQYIDALMREIIGFKYISKRIASDGRYAALVSTLAFFLHEHPAVDVVKADVFKSISLIKKMNEKYFAGGG